MVAIEDLKSGLERHGKTVTFLRTLLRDGLQAVEALAAKKGHDPRHAKAVETAASAIATISAAEDPAVRIREILATLRTELAIPLPRTASAAAAKPGHEFRSLRLQIAAASLVVWAAWALLSVITGAIFLIYQNPGFGTELDLLTCFTWGLGIAAAGQQASSSIGPGSVAQSIGVKLPK
jgi:hypothetical protein